MPPFKIVIMCILMLTLALYIAFFYMQIAYSDDEWLKKFNKKFRIHILEDVFKSIILLYFLLLPMMVWGSWILLQLITRHSILIVKGLVTLVEEKRASRRLAKKTKLLKRKQALKEKLASQILANARYRVAAVGHDVLDNPSKLQEISFLDTETVHEYCALCRKLV